MAYLLQCHLQLSLMTLKSMRFNQSYPIARITDSHNIWLNGLDMAMRKTSGCQNPSWLTALDCCKSIKGFKISELFVD